MSVIGSAITILAQRTPELAYHDHHGILPCRSHRVREAGDAGAELRHAGRQIAGCASLIHVRVPAAEIDETEIEPVSHERGHALGRGAESFRARSTTTCGLHFLRYRVAGHGLYIETGLNRRSKRSARVHAGDKVFVGWLETRAIRRVDCDVRDHDVAAKYE